MKRILQGILIGTAAYGVIFLLLFFSEEVTLGVKNGVSVCLSLMIPSTFLFLILTDILSKSRAGVLLARPFFFLSRLFRIRRCDVDIVVLSLIGGYPVGARILADRVRSGRIDRKSASRMLAFCVNSSPAFLYTGVGVSLFHSTAAGCIFLASSLLACLITGFFSRIGAFYPTAGESKPQVCQKLHPSVLLFSTVQKGVQSMAVICGFVVLFSACMPLFSSFLSRFLPQEAAACLCGLLEVCTGCASLFSSGYQNPMAAAMLFSSFGGVCVFLQIGAMLHGSGVSMRPMLFWRVFYTAVATALTTFLSRFLPPDAFSAFSAFSDTQPMPASVSPAAVCALLCCIILLLFFSVRPATIKVKESIAVNRRKREAGLK